MAKVKTKIREKKTATTDNIELPVSEEASAPASQMEADSSTATDSEEEFKRKYEEMRNNVSEENSLLFDEWESTVPDADFEIDVPIDSLESSIGYTSLFRQMHHAYVQRIAFYRSQAGGSLSSVEAKERAYHPCKNVEEAKKELNMLMNLPLESLSFIDLLELHSLAPRVAQKFWEYVKREGQMEFESGHLAANINFPVGYMKDLWNVARYLGVRESFIKQWQPEGGIEISLIDMMAQAYFQWQYWLEQTVKTIPNTRKRRGPPIHRMETTSQRDE